MRIFKSVRFPKLLFMIQGFIWILLGIGYYFYYYKKLDPAVVILVSAIMILFAGWLFLLGKMLREHNRWIYGLSIMTVVFTMVLLLMDEFGISDFVILAYNVILLLSLAQQWPGMMRKTRDYQV